MSACTGKFGQWFGHKFAPRYSKGAPTLSSFKNASPETAVAMIEATKPTTYHGDVCERCGAIINRPTAQGAE